MSPANIGAGKIRWGMVGGGQGAFIGAIHRMAAALDGQFELLAAAPSSDPERARRSGEELGLAPERVYESYEQMAHAERARADGIEAVTIVTPNHLHYAVASTFCRAGIAVICDKPLTSTLADAFALATLVRERGCPFFITYNYAAYPMVRQARAMVEAGELGRLRVIQVEYAQGWLATPLELSGSKQALWRTHPTFAGVGGCIGDIGTHAFQLARFVSRLAVTGLAAELTRFVEGRMLDDNALVLLRFEGGARGSLWASQVAVGEDNALRLRIYGERGSLSWCQERADELRFSPLEAPTQLLRRGGPAIASAARRAARLPAGHPEGYLEAFGSLYREIAQQLRASGGGAAAGESLIASIDEGLEGVRFVDTVVRSSNQGGIWLTF